MPTVAIVDGVKIQF